MLKKIYRLISFILIVAMFAMICPVDFISVHALSENAVVPTESVGHQLNYSQLQASAYIVNPQWTNLSQGQNLSYVFRGTTYNETYDPSRHFSSFDSAYSYFESLYTLENGNLKSGISEQTPVFILAPGTYSQPRMTVRYNAIILGANAGISPNASLDLDTANPKSGWAENTSRTNPTTVANGFSRSTRINGSLTNNKYELAAQNDGTTAFNLIIDGVDFRSASSFLTLEDTSSAVSRQMNVTIQNCNISTTNSSFYINDSNSPNNTNNYDFKNIRSIDSKTSGFYGTYACSIRMDGVYFSQSSGYLATSSSMQKENFSFTMQNSYIYKNTGSYNITFRYTDGNHKSKVMINHNLFYEHNSGSYGALMFYSTKTSRYSSYEIDIHNNTFIADKTYNSADKNTFLNGNTSYQQGAYTMTVNHNRVIGYTSLFPNMPDNASYIVADFNYNYFAPTYTSHSDVLGTESEYFSSTPYSDPIDIANLVYYQDYAMTIYDGMLDVSGVSFYDDADSVSIDNDNNLITAQYTCGKNISNPQLYFYDDGASSAFYSDSDCTNLITSVTAPAEEVITTVYAKVTNGSASKIMTVKLYGADASDSFADSWTDPEGIIGSDAYLLAPQTANMSSGSEYKAAWNGKVYTFTVGTNAFSSLDKIYEAAGSYVPQIILPYGTYGHLNITKPCQIYGENYESPAIIGDGIYDWDQGFAWNSGKISQVSGITLSCADVTVSGIELTGSFNDSSRTSSGSVVFKNSIINVADTAADGYRQFSITNDAVKTSQNSYTLDGIYIKSLPRESDGRHILLGGYLPSLLTVVNCYSDGAVSQLFDSQWNNTLYSWDCSVTVTDCRFDGIDMYSSILTDARDGVQSAQHLISYTIENNVFTSQSSLSGALLDLSPVCYNSLVIQNNIFINSASQNSKVLECDYKNLQYNGENFSFTDNRIVGFSCSFGAKNYGNALSLIDVSQNYFSDYSEDFSAAASGKCPQGFALCSLYYTDYAMSSLKSPISVNFTDKNGLVFDSINSALELNVSSDQQSLDFTDGYIENLENNILTGKYLISGNTADLSNISLNDTITTVELKICVPDNLYVFSTYTLKIIRQIPEQLIIEYITSDKGQISYNELNGGYNLTLPETSSSADITVNTPSGSSSQLIYNNEPASSISGVQSGENKTYIIRVSNGNIHIDYNLTVIRPISSGIVLDYDSYASSAYIIDSDWENVSSSNVSFVYRGTTYTQPYDANRHFSNFDDAYAHWLSGNPDILHDTPVFIFTAGTYGTIKINYRAIILGTNAGINPNDPNADVSELTPSGSIASNSEWDSQNETVFDETIYRTTRVSSNDILTLEKTVQDAEAAADEQMQFFLVIDGIKFTGSSYKVSIDDVDIGSRTDSENNISLTVTGRRKDTMYFQNIKSENQTGHLYTAQDTTFNFNDLTVKNIRVTGFNGSALFRKYLDTLVLDGAYITDSSMYISIFDVDSSMNMRHDMDYTVKNSAFVNNSLTRTIRIKTTPHSTGDFSSAKLEIYNNAFLETGSAEWGIISVSAQLPGITTLIHDNLFCQLGEYKIKTAIEGNSEFYNSPMTMVVNRNRFIGIQSYLPNLANVTDENLANLDFDFNNNYFSQSFTSVSDNSGTLPQYISGPDGNYDPIGADSLIYYHDYALQTLNTDFDITGVTFCNEETLTQIDNIGMTVKVTLLQNQTGQLIFTTRGSGTQQVLRPADSQQAVTQISYTDVLAGNTDYILTVTKNGTQKSFNVTLEANEIGFFNSTYSDPTGEIQNSAYLLDPQIMYKNDGDVFIREWKGEYYKFTVGQNAFSDISQINSVRPQGHIQIIIPDTEIPNELKIFKDTSVYGVNYDINPNVPIEDDISSDWTLNSQWGLNGESEVGSIAIDRNATGTDITIKGITLRGRFYDTERAVSSNRTSVTLENIVVEHESLLAESPYAYYSTVYTFTFSNPNSQTGNINNDIGVMRNIRIEKVMCGPDIEEGRNRLLNEYLPSDFTIDGLYCDLTSSTVSLFGWWKLSENQSDGRLTVKNCNFRNSFETSTSDYLYFEGRNHNNNTQGQTLELNLYDNCFYNFQTAASGFVISPYAYSNINIVGNLFLSTQAKTNQFIRFSDTSQNNGILEMNIFNNRFVGVSGNINNPQNNDTVDLSGNYYNSYSSNFKNATTTSSLTGSNTIKSWYYTNYALTSRSDGVAAYSFGNGMTSNFTSKTLQLTLGTGISTFSLNDYITFNGGNTFTISSVNDITSVPVADTTYTLTVTNGSASEQWSLDVNINPADMSALYTALDNASQYTNTDLYREFAYQRLITHVAEGKDIIHSDTAQKDAADNAAAKINLAIDILTGLCDLDDLISVAQDKDVSNAEPQKQTEFYAALNQAIMTADNPQSSLSDINNAYLALDNNLSVLDFDINEFTAVLDNAESIIESPVFKYYTRASSSELKAKYSLASDLYSGNYSLIELKTAMNQLKTAISGLKGNTALLAVAISKAEKINNVNGKYTTSSFAALTQAIQSAKALTNPTANDIMNACELLEDLKNSLVDLSEYKSVLERVESIDNNDNIYCTPTFEALTQAIADAHAAADDFTDKQKVNQIIEMLENAEANLKTHTLGTYISNNDATCTQDGTKTAHCTTAGCSYESTVTDTGSAFEHIWDEGTVTVPATCTEEGEMTYHCTRAGCDGTKTQAIPVNPDAHDWDEGVVTKEPTCTEDGEKTVSCTVDGCDVTGEVIPIPALGHLWDEGEVTKEPTCSAEGEMTYHCTRADCDGTKTQAIPVNPDAHVWDEGTVTTPATCQTEGVKTYTCKNNPEHTRTEAIPVDPDAHVWDEGVVTTEPTCSAAGVKTYTCKNDPAHTRTEVIPVDPNAHVWGEYVYNNDATTEADGTETAICQYCDATDTRTAEGTKIEILDSSTIFTDVDSGKWYKEYIDYVSTYKLMNGMNKTEFEPTTTLNRAMFVQILANMSGVDTANRDVETIFTDAPAGKWYTPAVKWASENGIVDGMTPTTFEPLEPIQRQQICVMVVRYAEKFGIELTADIEKKEFGDDAAIQNYAKEAVYICQQAGIVDGKTETDFLPRDNATRAEVAAIIMRFYKNFVAK